MHILSHEICPNVVSYLYLASYPGIIFYSLGKYKNQQRDKARFLLMADS